MRILVLSDSHGDISSMQMALNMHREAETIVFLGDGEDDFDYVRKGINDKMIYAVKGNCDFYSLLPANEIFNAGDVKVYASHGYAENVKYGTSMLYEKAREHGCKLALYGHTHIPKLEYDNGVYLFCPGSIRDGQYGMVDITEAGIICINAKL